MYNSAKGSILFNLYFFLFINHFEYKYTERYFLIRG